MSPKYRWQFDTRPHLWHNAGRTRRSRPMSDPTRTAAGGEAELTRTSDPSTLPEHPDTRTHDPDGTTAAGGVEHPAVPARAGSLLADRYRLTAGAAWAACGGPSRRTR